MTNLENAKNTLLAVLADCDFRASRDIQSECLCATEILSISKQLRAFLVGSRHDTSNYDDFMLDPVKWIKEH